MLGFNAIGMDGIGMSGAGLSTSVSAELIATFTVRAAASCDLPAAYTIRSAVSSDLGAAFGVFGFVDVDLTASYVVRSQVFTELPVAYEVQALALSSVSRDLVCAYMVEALEEYVRAPVGASYCRGAALYPESVKRMGLAEAAISLEAARLAARVDGNELDEDILTAAVAYTEAAEHLTNRAFVQGSWKAGYRGFDAEMILPKPPLVSVTRVAFYDPSGVLRVLAPQDYFVDVDAEPAVLTPAPGRMWPQTIDRKNAVEVQYVCGYGPTEASVPQTVKQYVKARIQQQFSPVATAKEANFDRLLDGLAVYL